MLTIYKTQSDAGLKVWENPKKPTSSELTPRGAEIIYYRNNLRRSEIVRILKMTDSEKREYAREYV